MSRRVLLVLVAVFALSITGDAMTLRGQAIAVADGDTITVLSPSKTQHKIRLAGIDAPERGQPFSNRSKHNLSELVFGKQVAVEYDKTDRYGRLVGKVLVDGRTQI